ncbi:MAG TPA: hypothetical protein VGM49_03800 [Candidatus Limnocylindrales bacterium]|jgi:hypothetical protein
MNVQRDPESILNAWLDEGPMDLPDATRRAILTSLPTTPQARRGPFAPWSSTRVSMFARGAAVLVVAVVAIGALVLLVGSRGGIAGATPSPVPDASASSPASAPPLPTLDATFVSSSYGYQVSYPTGWTVSPGVGPWPPDTDRLPGNPVSDAIVTPSGSGRVRISGASIALPSGTTMDQFRAFASPLSSPFNASACSPVAPLPVPVLINARSNSAASPQPVEAVVSVNGCYALAELGGYIYDVEVIAGGRGYTFTLDGHISTTDALAWLATIELEPAAVPTGSAVPSPSASK